MARIDVIERADALDALRDVPERSVGLLLTDPPYSSGGLFRGDRSGTTSSKYQTAGFAAKPDFYGDNRDERSLVLWSSMWMGLAFRALEPGASALVFTDWRQWANTADAMQVAGFVFRGPWCGTRPSTCGRSPTASAASASSPCGSPRGR